MSRHSFENNSYTIADALEPISLSDYHTQLASRRIEKRSPLTNHAEALDVKIPLETDEIVQSRNAFVTTLPLRGSQSHLNRNTLVYVESIQLPTDETEVGYDTFLDEAEWGEPSLYRQLGLISLNEPGLLSHRTKIETIGYMNTDKSGLELATLGLRRYLCSKSGIHTAEDPAEVVNDIMAEVYRRRHAVRALRGGRTGQLADIA